MPPKILSGVRIVVVEDHDDVRSVLAQYLRQQGARVIACSNAYEALEAVVQERPDLVLSDISLPDEDGFQLLQNVRSLGPEMGSNTPVIAMSALGATITNHRALAAGFCSYLGKPFTPQQLLHAIQEALRLQN
ncbi:MAG TPA: response regulator [Chthoniobacterales bacterium]|jgi:DNA-binding response OmpR family regulator|nr:response regulator [Chthoniobacterales bacterium]